MSYEARVDMCALFATPSRYTIPFFLSSFTFHVSTFDARVSSLPQPGLRHAEHVCRELQVLQLQQQQQHQKKRSRGLSAGLSELLEWAGFASWVSM